MMRLVLLWWMMRFPSGVLRMCRMMPAWTPPDWVFAPVWTILYATMAVAAWLVWRQGGFAVAHGPLALFLVQLALNVFW